MGESRIRRVWRGMLPALLRRPWTLTACSSGSQGSGAARAATGAPLRPTRPWAGTRPARGLAARGRPGRRGAANSAAAADRRRPGGPSAGPATGREPAGRPRADRPRFSDAHTARHVGGPRRRARAVRESRASAASRRAASLHDPEDRARQREPPRGPGEPHGAVRAREPGRRGRRHLRRRRWTCSSRGLEQRGFFRLARPTGGIEALFDERGRPRADHRRARRRERLACSPCAGRGWTRRRSRSPPCTRR